jgi:hypothetical protein
VIDIHHPAPADIDGVLASIASAPSCEAISDIVEKLDDDFLTGRVEVADIDWERITSAVSQRCAELEASTGSLSVP